MSVLADPAVAQTSTGYLVHGLYQVSPGAECGAVCWTVSAGARQYPMGFFAPEDAVDMALRLPAPDEDNGTEVAC